MPVVNAQNAASPLSGACPPGTPLGTERMTPDGRVFKATRDGAGGLRWAEVSAGGALGQPSALQVLGRISSASAYALSGDRQKLTASALGDISSSLPWSAPAVGDRFLLLAAGVVGIWAVDSLGGSSGFGSFIRPAAYDTPAELPRIVYVQQGATGRGEFWMLLDPLPPDWTGAVVYRRSDEVSQYNLAHLTPDEVSPSTEIPSAFSIVRVGMRLRVVLTPAATGAADDVSFILPRGIEIAGVRADIITVVAASTLTLRTAAGGGGAALSGAIPSDVVGRASEPSGGVSGTRVFAAGTTLYIRRSDRAVAATVWIEISPE